MGNDAQLYIEKIKVEADQGAQPRIWHDAPANRVGTLQQVFLDFTSAPSVLDLYGGFSKMVTKKTMLQMLFYACSDAPDIPLHEGRWPTLKLLVWHVLGSSQAYCGHHLLRDYFDVCDAVLCWLDSVPAYVPAPTRRAL